MGRTSSYLLLALLAATPALVAQVTETGTVRGRILDASGAPIAGVRIELSSYTLVSGPRVVITNQQGEWTASLLVPGPWVVEVKDRRFIPLKATFSLNKGEVKSFEWILKRIPEAACTVEVVASAMSSVDCTQMQTATNLAPGVKGGRNKQNQFVINGLNATSAHVRTSSAPWNTEQYHAVKETSFLSARQAPLSTFSIDVDTASYSNMRRFLNEGQLPPADAVRLEELVNYFPYDYDAPSGSAPFAVTTEVLACPWQPEHRLMRVALQGKRLEAKAIPPRNLVFLIDVSGSMSDENKLPLVKRGLEDLVKQLRAEDRVAMVVYAGSSGLVLPPTSGQDKPAILEALDRLGAGGSTHGAAGIQQAYEVARQNFQRGADNRVILCTDGDFNVGVSDEGSLLRMIEKERESGVFLTCLGFGMGNLKDGMMEQLADKGNGSYAYIDSLPEMRKVFGAGGAGLVTIAKDVKLQVEFNPSKVQAYRLLGYENRRLENEDFNNDAKDAGDMNAGHCVTALYELIPPGVAANVPSVDPLKYQTGQRLLRSSAGEIATVKVRFKKPDAFFSKKLELPVPETVLPFEKATESTRWACAVAAAAMSLRDSADRGEATLPLAAKLASDAIGKDADGYRKEFLALLQKAMELKK